MFPKRGRFWPSVGFAGSALGGRTHRLPVVAPLEGVTGLIECQFCQCLVTSVSPVGRLPCPKPHGIESAGWWVVLKGQVLVICPQLSASVSTGVRRTSGGHHHPCRRHLQQNVFRERGIMGRA